MLQQNWFYAKNMIMIAENPETQVFYDTNNTCFYIVSDENNHIIIHQYTPENPEYQTLTAIKTEYDTEKDPVFFTAI